jgi:hypothetical protein
MEAGLEPTYNLFIDTTSELTHIPHHIRAGNFSRREEA